VQREQNISADQKMIYNAAMTVPFEPHRFRSTVPYYVRYRVPYPNRLIAFVAEGCGLERASHVLDLGCGPGQLAIAFARLGSTVTAIDPEPSMLAAARECAAAAGVSLKTIEGSSYDLNPTLGHFRLVTLGRSFHWMDRDATLAVLDRMIERGGAIALFGDKRIETRGADWRALLERLQQEFVPELATERRERKKTEEPDELVLLRSAFFSLERHGVIVMRRLGADDIVGRAYASSTTSPAALGERRPAFEEALREGLAGLAPTGEFSEIVEVTALIARRSADGCTAPE
jgi:SAM-dependent methyltransferase